MESNDVETLDGNIDTCPRAVGCRVWSQTPVESDSNSNRHQSGREAGSCWLNGNFCDYAW
jgi:hypothetical protein